MATLDRCKMPLFYSCKNCNESLCPTEWRILIHRFPTYVDGEVARVK
jgi:hypothetical protein